MYYVFFKYSDSDPWEERHFHNLDLAELFQSELTKNGIQNKMEVI